MSAPASGKPARPRPELAAGDFFETADSRSPRSKLIRRGTIGSDPTTAWALDFVNCGHYVDFQTGQICPDATRPTSAMQILMMTGDAGEAQEIFYAKFRLEEEGWGVTIAAPRKKTLLSVVHDFEPGFETYTEKPGYRVEADASFDEIDPAMYHGLVLPGGRAPEYLRMQPRAIELVSHFLDARKPIAAICHGPLLLMAAGYGRGCRMTAYPALEFDVRQADATFEDREFIRDSNVITSRGWPDNGPWMREFVKLLKEGGR